MKVVPQNVYEFWAVATRPPAQGNSTVATVRRILLLADHTADVRKVKIDVTIQLSEETAKRLREIAARRGQTLDAYLEWLATVSAGSSSGPPPDQTAEEWVAAWRSWVDSHASNPHVADDSRESIYGDRGL